MTNQNFGRTLTAMFDTRAEADRAAADLKAIGATDVVMHGDNNPGYGKAEPHTENEGGFWDSLSDFFFPEEDRASYAEGLKRGGYLLTAKDVPENLVPQALEILDREGAVDMDRREAEWKESGWQASTVPASGVAGTAAATAPRDANPGETIDVVEEQVNIGKRDVQTGSVRVRSYVREVPVSKDIELTEEHVDVERRAVDRPADAGAFEDKVIEAHETSERAVVDKEARVVEEVSLNKTADTHVETVKDTVRKTEVEVDKD